MAKKKALATDKVLQELRAFGLAYPGAHTKSPWPGHLDLAVNDKTFAYLSLEGEPLGISCKLPQSSEVALMLPFCKPTAYGLGKSGWVSAQFPEGKVPSVEMLKQWIDESYRAQAPKKLVKQLDGDSSTPPPVKKSKAVAKRTAAAGKTKRASKRVS
jgi:predicted DNA-binding protein (MmcQ/YjbR family)